MHIYEVLYLYKQYIIKQLKWSVSKQWILVFFNSNYIFVENFLRTSLTNPNYILCFRNKFFQMIKTNLSKRWKNVTNFTVFTNTFTFLCWKKRVVHYIMVPIFRLEQNPFKSAVTCTVPGSLVMNVWRQLSFHYIPHITLQEL